MFIKTGKDDFLKSFEVDETILNQLKKMFKKNSKKIEAK